MSSDYEYDYNQYASEVQTTFADLDTAAAVPFLLFGAIFAFFGLKLFKCMLCLVGFTIGVIAGGGLGFYATEDANTAAVVGLIFGVVAGFVVMWARRVAYFVFGVGLGCGVAVAVTFFVFQKTTADFQSTLMISSIVLGIPGGILAVYIGDYIVIVSTGISGAAELTMGCAILFHTMSPAFLVLVFIGWAVLGIYFQIRMREHWKHATAGYGHHVVVQTEVNTNVTTNNTVELLIQAPQAQQYPPMYPSQGYPPQGYPAPGYPTPGYSPQGYPTQGYPTPVVQNQIPAPVVQV